MLRGTTIVWTNEDRILHTVTSGVPRNAGIPGVTNPTPASPDGRFNERLEGRGSTARVTLRERGVFPYFCEIHAGMTGEIVVS